MTPRVRRLGASVVMALVPLLGIVTTVSAATPAGGADGTLQAMVLNRINAIRVASGLSRAVGTTAFTAEVQRGALKNADPALVPESSGIVGESSLWGVEPGSSAVAPISPIGVVDGWVSHDGWEGSVAKTWNVDCGYAKAPGCDGHRRSILSRPPTPGARLYVDVGTRHLRFDGGQALSIAVLMVWKRSGATAP